MVLPSGRHLAGPRLEDSGLHTFPAGAIVFWESILGDVEETDVTECLTNFMTSSRMGTVTGAATWQSSACWEIDLE